MKKTIVLIGGPGSGKTTLINALSEKGYTCLPEISRDVTLAAQKNGVDQLFLEQPLLFSELLLQGRIKQFQEAVNSENHPVFIDRGIPDVLAYMHYIGDSYPVSFDQACRDHLYDGIFMLPPWEEIYQSDNERYETYEQAIQIHEHLIETYRKYGYEPIMVPKDTVEGRIDFLLSQL